MDNGGRAKGGVSWGEVWSRLGGRLAGQQDGDVEQRASGGRRRRLGLRLRRVERLAGRDPASEGQHHRPKLRGRGHVLGQRADQGSAATLAADVVTAPVLAAYDFGGAGLAGGGRGGAEGAVTHPGVPHSGSTRVRSRP